MKKLISLLLALMLVVSMIPMVVGADEVPTYSLIGGKWYEVTSTGNVPVADPGKIADLWADYNAILASQKKEVHEPGKHKYGVQYNTKYHWLGCACGCKISMERHVDPKDAPDDICTCGYKFSSNADLVTLWVGGCPEIKDFRKDKTEYTLTAYTYKDVKKVKISTRTYDSEATVELPEDLTLKEGTNVIPVKVTAENQKNTKTYTLTIIKEST